MSTPSQTRPGIECPVCGSGTYVVRTDNYVSWIRRTRICRNPACRHSFDTQEKSIGEPRREGDLFG